MTSELLIAIAVTLAAWAAVFVIIFALWSLVRNNWLRGASFTRQLRDIWTSSPPARWGRDKFPRAWRFSANRISTHGFIGLPLTLFVCGAIYFVFLLAGIIEELFEAEELKATDEMIFSFVEPLRSDGAIALYKWITHFGDLETLLALSLVITAMLTVHGPRRFILPLWVSVLGAQITSWSGKYLFARNRPDFVVDISVNSPSFPSGHATGAVSVYVLFAYILARDIEHPFQRFVTYYALTAIALTIAFSRIFLGVHYPSDVAAGVLVGCFWVTVAISIAELTRINAFSDLVNQQQESRGS